MKKTGIFTFFIAFFMIISLSGCNDKSNVTDDDSMIVVSQENNFGVKEIQSEETDYNNLLKIKYCSDIDVFYAQKYELINPKDYSTAIIAVDGEFNKCEIPKIELKDNERIIKWDSDTSGNIAFVIMKSSVKSNDDNCNEDIIEREYIIKYYDYIEKKTKNLSIDAMDKDDSMTKELFVFSNNRIILYMYNYDSGSFCLYSYDVYGNFEYSYIFEEADWIYDIQKSNSGLCLVYSEKGKKYIAEYNVLTSELENILEVPVDAEQYNIVSCTETGDMYLISSSRLIRKTTDNTFEDVCDLNSLGIDENSIVSIQAVSKNDFIFIEKDDITGNLYLNELSESGRKCSNERKKITLAAGWMNDDVKSEIVRFNRSSEQYRISMIDYSVYNNPETGMTGEKKLAMEYLSSDVPDIVLYTSFRNGRILEKLGAFADLYSFIDNDSEIQKDDFNSEVMSAYENNGALYSLPVYYSIGTIAGLSEYLSDKETWDISDMIKLYRELPVSMKFSNENTRSSITDCIFYYMLADYIDYDDCKCSINSGEVLEFLKFVKTFDLEGEGGDLFEIPQKKSFIAPVEISTFEDFHDLKSGYFDNKDVVYIGFPTNSGKGTFVSSDLQFSISAKSDNKTEAWNILRELYKYDYQISIESGFPINNQAFDDKAEMACVIHLDETGKEIENIFKYSDKNIGYSDINEIEELKRIISKPLNTYVYDYNLYQICEEELEPFFYDDQSPEETIERIEKRIEIYLNEIK